MTPKKRTAIMSLLAIGFGTAFVSMLMLAYVFDASTYRLHQITRDLYVHPFAVNNAAASLKTALFQMRSSALLMVATRLQGAEWQAATDEIAAYEKQAREDLAVINAAFLGDMSKVRQIEVELEAWHAIRTQILDEVRLGNFDVADQMVRAHGSPKFNELIELTDYVLSYSRWRAGQFDREGELESSALIERGNLLALILLVSFVLTTGAVIWRVRFLQNELSRQATTDFLTGIANRRYFLGLVQAEIARARRYGDAFSLAVVDLDYFKNINDTHGHLGGDRVLQGFCHVCRASLRDTDVVGRLGGEEFGILMPSTRLDEAVAVIERLRESIEATPVEHEQAAIRFTASFGLAEMAIATLPTDELLGEIFRRADEALYRAKKTGRNRVMRALD